MNERVRQKVREIIQQHGREICGQPRRCKGLLLDHCAGDRREVFVLVSALEEQVVADLLEGLGGRSWEMVSRRLVHRLVENRAIAEEAALWAVETWALALGLRSEARLSPRQPPPPGPSTNPLPSAVVPCAPANRSPSVSVSPPIDAPDVITTTRGQIQLRLIPAGGFWMGSPDDDPDASEDERPHHEVQIHRAFYLGVTSVTQAQYEAVMGKNPSHFGGRRDHPVENVTWFDALRFCNALSRNEALPPYYSIGRAKRVQVPGGLGYRLPTEAEWEYACRAGSDERFCYGADPERLGEYASYSRNSAGGTCPARRNLPNAYGLYDMHGNVWEWCWDGYDRSFYRRSRHGDPPGIEGTTRRVVRGGSWNDEATDVRSASRYGLPPEGRFNFVGFRVARGLPDR